MAHRNILSSTYEPEMPQLDRKVNWIAQSRGIVTRAAETLSEVGTLALLVILAAKESLKHRRSNVDVEQLREYGDWVD